MCRLSARKLCLSFLEQFSIESALNISPHVVLTSDLNVNLLSDGPHTLNDIYDLFKSHTRYK